MDSKELAGEMVCSWMGRKRDEWREGCCREGWVQTHTPSASLHCVQPHMPPSARGVPVTQGALQVCGVGTHTHTQSPLRAGVSSDSHTLTPSGPSPPAPTRGYPGATPPRAPLLRFLSPPPVPLREEGLTPLPVGLGVGIF